MGLTRSMSARAGGCAALAAIYLGLAATPSAANISGSFGVDPDTNAITLNAISDDEGDTIALGCANERVTINGQTIILGNGFSVACGGSNGPEVIQIFGGGGGDRVVNTGLSPAAGFTNILRSEGFGGDEIVVEADAGQDTVIGGRSASESTSSSPSSSASARTASSATAGATRSAGPRARTCSSAGRATT